MQQILTLDFIIFLFFLNDICMCVSACGFVHISAELSETKRSQQSPVSWVIDSYEPPGFGAGISLQTWEEYHMILTAETATSPSLAF